MSIPRTCGSDHHGSSKRGYFESSMSAILSLMSSCPFVPSFSKFLFFHSLAKGEFIVERTIHGIPFRTYTEKNPVSTAISSLLHSYISHSQVS